MNWRLIFMLSLFGLAMAIATVFWVPEKAEWAFWLAIFLINAYLIAKNAAGKYFLTGFMVSLVNCVYIVGAHVLFYATYMDNHPMMAQMGGHMPMHNHPRLAMILMGPLFGIGFGMVQGLLAWIAGMVFKKPAAAV